jgi:SsrA-binding protein
MSKVKAKETGVRDIVAVNRRASFDYLIEETLEAGLVLQGTEVKALRSGKSSIAEAHVDYIGEEIFLLNAHIPEYGKAGRFNHSPRRPRKLLLHKRQVKKLFGLVKIKGIALIPLKIYFNQRNIAKVEIGLAKGKKQHDKREAIKERDWQRKKARALHD